MPEKFLQKTTHTGICTDAVEDVVVDPREVRHTLHIHCAAAGKLKHEVTIGAQVPVSETKKNCAVEYNPKQKSRGYVTIARLKMTPYRTSKTKKTLLLFSFFTFFIRFPFFPFAKWFS